MKKLVVLFTVFLFCLSCIAKDLGASWVITGEGKIDCKTIKLGLNNARIVFEDGKKSIIPIDAISSFAMNNKVYNKLPLYKNGKSTDKMVFMELLKTIGELSLYKFVMCNMGSPDPQEKINCYFVYNGTKLYLALDETSLPSVCKYFDVTYSYDY